MSGTGADRLVETLVDLGVSVAFGLPGVHNLAVWEALGDSGVRLVGVRHEQTAVYAADGYARATGRLGVALVTTGPGAANTLGATGEALTSGSPVLVIATDIPTTLRRPGTYRGVLHECTDQRAMFVPVTREAWNVESADEISGLARRAAERAMAAPSGPVYLGIPTNLLKLPATEPSQNGAQAAVGEPPQFHSPEIHGGKDSLDSGAVDRDAALALIAAAERPLIWAGRGALQSGAGAQVAALAERLAAPIVTTYGARGLVAPDHPLVAPTPIHEREVGPLWDESDLVIGVGTDFDGMMTQNWAMPRPPKLVTVNVDPADAAKNYAPDVALTGDAAAVLDDLLPYVTERGGTEAVAARLAALGEEVAATVRRYEPLAADFLAVLRREVPEETPIVCDMCIPGYWIGGYHPVPLPRTLAYPMGWGTLGFGFPASVGAAVAMTGSGRRALCVTGDGGFMYACGELATIAQEDAPLTVVLVNDGGYGMLRYDQEHSGKKRGGVDLHTPDFAAMARTFGIPATAVTGFGDDFADALRDSLAADGPNVIAVTAAMQPPCTASPLWYRGEGN